MFTVFVGILGFHSYLQKSGVPLDGEDADAVVAPVGDEDVPAVMWFLAISLIKSYLVTTGNNWSHLVASGHVPAGGVDGDAAARVEHVGEGGRDRLDHLHELQALRSRLCVYDLCKDGKG